MIRISLANKISYMSKVFLTVKSTVVAVVKYFVECSRLFEEDL